MREDSPTPPLETMTLCKHCASLAGDWLVARMIDLRDSEYPAHNEPVHHWTYSSWQELEDSAKTCPLCALVVNVSRIDQSGPFTKTDKSGIRWSVNGGSRIDVWCEELKLCSELNIGFERDDLPRVAEDVDKIFDARIVSKRVGDERSIKTILHWMKFCRDHHKLCSSVNSQPLPTRILDVGTKENPTLRLHIGNKEVAEYAALSYCWGTSEKYMTTKDNLQSHLSRINMDDLPPALQDAISLTRLLNLRYIWIDALCIIQGDQDDWIHEAGLMHQIYARATLTIALDMLSDTSSRVFTDRSKRHDLIVPLPWPFQTKDKEPVNLYVAPSWPFFSSEMARAPLSKRAWSFQERALSTRVLHISEIRCFWECKEACIGEEVEIGKYIENDGFGYLKGITSPKKDGIEPSTVELHESWAWVVEEFSRRRLTVEGDKFVALAGITTVFATKGKLGKHFCGLWENEFLRHLLWYPTRREAPLARHKRPSKYRAPSWSWAAIDGPVESPFIKRALARTPDGGLQLMDELGNDNKFGTSNLLTHKILTILSIEVENEGETSFGPVVRGHLKAMGLLIPVKRGRHLQEGTCVLETLAGDAVGNAVWDVDDFGLQNSLTLFLCPVMQCRDIVDGWALSEGLVLKSADASEGESLIFERLGKGRTKNFFANHIVLQTFTII